MTGHETLASLLTRGLARMGLDGGADLCDGLLHYLDELTAWNRAYNLTAVRDPAAMIPRHLLDSLAVVPWVQGPRLIDVGSGAGLPGIPLALALPDLEVTLLDSNGKKARFLRHVARTLALANVAVVEARVEAHRPTAGYQTLTARAFAAVDELVRLGAPLLAGNGRILALRGREDAVPDLPGWRTGAHELSVPGLDASRHLLMIEREP